MLALALAVYSLATPQTQWHDDYAKAVRLAMDERKDLFIYFRADDRYDAALSKPEVAERLDRYVCLQVKPDYMYEKTRLLDHPAMREMMGKPGFVVVSFHDPGLSTYQEVVSVHPLVKSHYKWVPDYGVDQLKVILDLPAKATLTQRSMIYAVRVHPERPKSVDCECHPAFLEHCQRHCAKQAAMQHQHHADLIAASNQLEKETGVNFRGSSEVVAESWGKVLGGENVLEAAFSCVDAWRHSPGHWGAVSRSHRYFGYDIAMGANGTWYATGIFAD